MVKNWNKKKMQRLATMRPHEGYVRQWDLAEAAQGNNTLWNWHKATRRRGGRTRQWGFVKIVRGLARDLATSWPGETLQPCAILREAWHGLTQERCLVVRWGHPERLRPLHLLSFLIMIANSWMAPFEVLWGRKCKSCV